MIVEILASCHMNLELHLKVIVYFCSCGSFPIFITQSTKTFMPEELRKFKLVISSITDLIP